MYKNRLGAGKCDNSTFGKSAGACQEGPDAYYRYDHVYSCSGPGDPNWKAATGANACPDADFNGLYGGCCVFTPKIQVVDNWGFCNGTCPTVVISPATGQLLSPSDGSNCIDAECDDVNPFTSDNPWTSFAGDIVIAP
ncbi:hypothetical protein A3B21_04555 [Candidatus Uhrbacteria bacterium RIFCSPLOWO2_01_FULL_47_24]|uniref:Uncharacterized protein n=1 Tax=Candidatus Uhrbacteria bacterium RIFCSPLOWO2_01_FULL_47_24 TaxID=1802401 RepID=A0A1F7UTS3_9BACT|nr:MAG: hypothetical protein A2753_01980 [Candidatus Uhrbacteria bacterium RIFCSPHIGHO2_01_FULL_47_11]OGL68933.1 MAG: hypothetical protein A3D58_00305 [Candidatus Uhrbacteria bacterium RIFCSPHIGHO2_02_FULL_46_47]OGL81691.1 MAG: hypothetical protein A3B21_04555 [Candidatus Uhrbacteria bacterium RIFCSPLOWO2_01_FULL_47_24]OGL85056.1 MAG: hypothetical protein A3J03_03765 [Candidatus Uhrbacteria bacterium RIFCSPLOWO2_02_FULL_46_25]OGL93135.1 MAG: hypothetical protein A3H11_00170 [Candidatus Uhrbacte